MAMFDRFRLLLDHPLDPSAARAILVLASGIFIGLAALIVLAGSQTDSTAPHHRLLPLADPIAPEDQGRAPAENHRPAPNRRQDPQDVAGSAAAERAAHALRSHRALQHIPFEAGEVTIVLAGARDSRAVLRVTAPTVALGRLRWNSFLRRYRDSGRAYFPVFDGRGG